MTAEGRAPALRTRQGWGIFLQHPTESRRKPEHAMAWPFLEGTIKIIVTYTIGGKPQINVHFASIQGGGPTDPTDMLKVANDTYDAYNDNWKLSASSNAEITEIEAINWEAEAGRVAFTSQTLPIVGDVASPAMPNQVALVTTKKTNWTGRSKRGRTYFAGLSEASVDGNDVEAAVITNFQTTLTDLIVNLDLNLYNLVVYSLYTGGAPRASPFITVVSALSTNARVDTQRRRLPIS